MWTHADTYFGANGMKVVLDLESNGLLKEATKIWCAVAYNIETGQEYRIDTHEGDYTKLLDLMRVVTHWSGHNILGYDIPLLYKLTGFVYTGFVCDTLEFSRTLNPDRELPEGCPTHMLDPLSGKKKLVGAHGLEAWGYRVARAKPKIDRWDVYTPDILHRCSEDVHINYQTLLALLEEANLSEVPYVR